MFTVMRMKVYASLILLVTLVVGNSLPAKANTLAVREESQAVWGSYGNSESSMSNNQSALLIQVPGAVSDLQSAINQVADGGIIEIAGGVYPAPSGGFQIENLSKSFTIRAASGATVILDGQGQRDIVRFKNPPNSSRAPVLFQGLTFANGVSGTETRGGAITLSRADATFVDCVFRNNFSSASGGAMYVGDGSNAFFVNTLWQDNASKSHGGAMLVRWQANVYIHNSRFIHNITNTPGHHPSASGGAINLADSKMRITNTRFENNQAAAFGGAVYIIGVWDTSTSNPKSDVLITNSTFVDNRAAPDPSVQQDVPTEGGAINVEDQSVLKVYNSRFIKNSAMIGGGLNVYRASAEVYGSVFQGNQANGQVFTAAFSGAISVTSADGPGDGTNNRPNGNLILEDSLIQGRYGSVGTVAQGAGGVLVSGDSSRTDGSSGVPDMGTLEENMAKAVIRRVVFYDLDVQANPPYAAVAGAVEVAQGELTLEDSLVMNSDAIGVNTSGGGVGLLVRSVGNIRRTTFANNSAGLFGGAIFSQGSTLNVSDSKFFRNEVSPGQQEAENSSYGAAIFTAMDAQRNIPAAGVVAGSLFSNNIGLAIFDDDRDNGPANNTQYNGNQFYETTFGTRVYKDALFPPQTTSMLNNLVVQRANGTTTDKSTVNNTELSSAPVVGTILAVPPYTLPHGAAGDTPNSHPSFLGYAWNGGPAQLQGSEVSGNSGLTTASEAGEYTLSVNGTGFKATVAQGVSPAASFNVASSGGSYLLSWSVQSGAFLDVAIDQGVKAPRSASGQVQAPSSVARPYRLFVVTKEGGAVYGGGAGAPSISIPNSVNVMAGLNLAVNHASLPITNNGGGTLSWTAQSSTPDLIQLQATSGATQGTDYIGFVIDTAGLKPGKYTGYVKVSAGVAGEVEVAIEVRVVEILYRALLPSIRK